jgi:hypothetical protein
MNATVSIADITALTQAIATADPDDDIVVNNPISVAVSSGALSNLVPDPPDLVDPDPVDPDPVDPDPTQYPDPDPDLTTLLLLIYCYISALHTLLFHT